MPFYLMHLLGVETGMRKGMLLINLLLMEEILHQLISSLSHYLQGFIHPRWLGMGFRTINSSFWKGPKIRVLEGLVTTL